MRKYVKRLYELDRTFDYGKEGSLKKRKFVKLRARKRLRQQLKPIGEKNIKLKQELENYKSIIL